MRKILTNGLGLLALAAVIAFAAAPAARAGLWDFSYTGNSTTATGGSGTITASGLLTTSDVLNPIFNGYAITGISGSRTSGSGSVSIDGLVPATGLPSGTTNSSSSNGFYVIFDNILLSPPGFDINGLFYDAGGVDFNLFNNGSYLEYPLGAGSYPGTNVTLTLTPVSEPGTLAIFGFGALATIFFARRGRGSRTKNIAA